MSYNTTDIKVGVGSPAWLVICIIQKIHFYSMRPNIFVGVLDGSAMYKKWYFEAVVDYIESSTHLAPHLRVGWANTEGYKPFPGGGENWGGNGVGDDLYSYGFDGLKVWSG